MSLEIALMVAGIIGAILGANPYLCAGCSLTALVFQQIRWRKP